MRRDWKASGMHIVCDITATGPQDSRAGTPWTDAQIQAMSGLMDTTGFAHGAPARIGIALTEISAALYAAAAIASAVRVKRLRGIVQNIDVTLMGCAASALTTFLPAAFARAQRGTRGQSSSGVRAVERISHARRLDSHLHEHRGTMAQAAAGGARARNSTMRASRHSPIASVMSMNSTRSSKPGRRRSPRKTARAFASASAWRRGRSSASRICTTRRISACVMRRRRAGSKRTASMEKPIGRSRSSKRPH